MTDYNGLAGKIAYRYSVSKGAGETQERFLYRLVYTLAGDTGIISLLDQEEAEVSVNHVKSRIRDVLLASDDLFPGAVPSEEDDIRGLIEEIYELMRANGFFYHSPNRLLPCEDRTADFKGIRFSRAIINDRCFFSGFGRYSAAPVRGSMEEVFRLFHIDPMPIIPYLEQFISRAVWGAAEPEGPDTEFLSLKVTEGYWTKKKDTSGKISLMRKGPEGGKRYYLYKVEDRVTYLSGLPDWAVGSGRYFKLAAGVLSQNGMLPPARTVADGGNVIIHFGYLPAEDFLRFVKLYSWPEDTFTNDFKRRMPEGVWKAVKEMLVYLGYSVQ